MLLGGGLARNRVFLIQGTPGAGKTTLALQFLLAGTAAGEKTVYLTLSESRKELEAVARAHGWSLERVVIKEVMPSLKVSSASRITLCIIPRKSSWGKLSSLCCRN